eukprot:TRINITY_DN1198_c0_g1_i6.p1 TRINITY_DN1198_c0_g1~~TRINITY_DN1198_c0_g1_i6.p1  ORF type:complete len:222 (+),score=25.55 TRINITY_DN1198_c0_g1_i6:73-738(+)
MNRTILCAGGCLSLLTLILLIIGASLPWYVWKDFTGTTTSCSYSIMQHWNNWVIYCRDCPFVQIPFSESSETCNNYLVSANWRKTLEVANESVSLTFNVALAFLLLAILSSFASLIFMCIRGMRETTRSLKVMSIIIISVGATAAFLSCMAFLQINRSYDKDGWCSTLYDPTEDNPCNSFHGSMDDTLSDGKLKWLPGAGWIATMISLPFALGALAVAACK